MLQATLSLPRTPALSRNFTTFSHFSWSGTILPLGFFAFQSCHSCLFATASQCDSTSVQFAPRILFFAGGCSLSIQEKFSQIHQSNSSHIPMAIHMQKIQINEAMLKHRKFAINYVCDMCTLTCNLLLLKKHQVRKERQLMV